jgi:membrane protease YdiL (CAAX protease family)
MPLAVAAFLVVTGGVVPTLAWRTHRQLSAGVPLPPRPLLYIQILVLQLGLGALALVAASRAGVRPVLRCSLGARSLTGAAVLVGLGLGAATLRWHYGSKGTRERLRSLLPDTRREQALWVAACAAAAVCEELVYRGTLFQLARGALGGYWAPAIVSAAIFALAHLAQGWSAAPMTFGFGLGFQYLVRVSGGLGLAMAAHFTYDLLVELGFPRAAPESPPQPAAAERTEGEYRGVPPG